MSFVRGLFCLKSTVTNPIHGNATMSIYSGSTDSEKRFDKNIYDFSMEKAGKSSKFSHIGDGKRFLGCGPEKNRQWEKECGYPQFLFRGLYDANNIFYFQRFEQSLSHCFAGSPTCKK